jgi:hypothetical protein
MNTLSPQQKLLLEATQHLESQTYLFGGGQSAAVNCYIWQAKPDWKKDAISQCRKGLIASGLLVKGDKGRIELTPAGKQALEAGSNGNGSIAKESPAKADGLDPATRRQLDRLLEILERSQGWVDLAVLKTDWGLSTGLAYNAVALAPGKFSVRDNRLFLLSHQA